jgi:hypothetical protein
MWHIVKKIPSVSVMPKLTSAENVAYSNEEAEAAARNIENRRRGQYVAAAGWRGGSAASNLALLFNEAYSACGYLG